MAEGAFEPGGQGVRSCQKVRILHATIRHHLLHDPAWNWDWGVPINQEDMAGTLVSFSACSVRSIALLGVQLTPEEEAYSHIWSVVGYLLGIDERLLPRSYAKDEALMDTIIRRHWEPSPEGQAMTRALVDYMKYVIPGNVFDGLPAVLIRFLCGDRAADMLGVAPPDWTVALLGPFRSLWGAVDGAQNRSAMAARLSAIVGRMLLEGMHYVLRGGRRYHIRMPKSVRERWNISGP